MSHAAVLIPMPLQLYRGAPLSIISGRHGCDEQLSPATLLPLMHMFEVRRMRSLHLYPRSSAAGTRLRRVAGHLALDSITLEISDDGALPGRTLTFIDIRDAFMPTVRNLSMTTLTTLPGIVARVFLRLALTSDVIAYSMCRCSGISCWAAHFSKAATPRTRGCATSDAPSCTCQVAQVGRRCLMLPSVRTPLPRSP